MSDGEREAIFGDQSSEGRNRPSPWDRRKKLAARLDALGRTAQQTADAVGCHVGTVRRWRAEAAYQAAVDAAASDVEGLLRDRVLGLQAKALDALEEAIEADDVPDETRFEAIDKVQALAGIKKRRAR